MDSLIDPEGVQQLTAAGGIAAVVFLAIGRWREALALFAKLLPAKALADDSADTELADAGCDADSVRERFLALKTLEAWAPQRNAAYRQGLDLLTANFLCGPNTPENVEGRDADA